jgi:intein-encoded DNA endonuclease-like protein
MGKNVIVKNGAVYSFQVISTRIHGVTTVKTVIFALNLSYPIRKRKRTKEEGNVSKPPQSSNKNVFPQRPQVTSLVSQILRQ